MIIERFKYHEKFCVKSTFLDTSIDVEGTLEPGETLKEGVAQAREQMLKALPTQDPIPSSQGIDIPPYPTHHPIQQVENREQAKADIKVAIEACTLVEQLKEYKRLASTSPELTSAYMNKLKSISNGVANK